MIKSKKNLISNLESLTLALAQISHGLIQQRKKNGGRFIPMRLTAGSS